MSGAEVIQLLDAAVDWYRTLGLQQQAANEPSDLLIFYENRQIGNEVLGLAFDLARADADLLAKDPSAAPDKDGAAPPQALTQLQAKLDVQASTVQKEMDAARQSRSTATKKNAAQLTAKISELRGELDLINTKKSIVGSLATFGNSGSGASGTGATSGGALRAQIDAMALAMPSASNAAAAPGGTSGVSAGVGAGGAPTAPHAAAPAAPAPAPLGSSVVSAAPADSRFGLWDLASEVVRLSQKISNIDSVDRRTADLQAMLKDIRAKLVDQLRALSARGDALATQADNADGATLGALHDQLDALAAEFKATSAVFIPLSKEGVLLNQYRHNLKNWRDAIKSQSHDVLRKLGIRLGVLAIILAVVFTLAEVWQRAVMKYVQEARRRYQLLLLRRIALWALVVVIIGFAFANELGSIVTFAGLITAGLAVAMQSVLVSIVGYFFLIGKYGLRVGDRVQIGDVYGEVLELGFVRMYLMELAARGSLGATGRLVAFPNSVVFQVTAGLFKQMPGVNLIWHEFTLKIPDGADYTASKEKLTAAVVGALGEYRAGIDQQTQEIQRTAPSSVPGSAEPTVRLNLSGNGLEAHIRYPVNLQQAAEIDERVSHALLLAVEELRPQAADGARAT